MRATAIFAAAVLAWLGAYAFGIFPWLGSASLKRSSFGAGAIAIVGENRAGSEFGLSTFLFVAGQEVVIAYDADIKAGSLWFHVYRPYDSDLGGGASHYVTVSGSGTWTTPIETTGIYHVTVEPSPARGSGRGWDLSYSAKWGAREAQHR